MVVWTYQRSVGAQLGFIDIRAAYEHLKSLGVAFTMDPTELANVTIAVFDDTCGNLIQIMQT